ncbi:MAG: hypothetical protein M3R54_03260, partial [Chloroflexota bacterium]|nr:hypothetical protein [Chloroflexota bacterium]
LTFTEAYQTWTKEAHEIEDALAGDAPDLRTIGSRLDQIDIPFEEWEILYRMLLQVRLRQAKVLGGDEVKTSAQPRIWDRIEAAVAALTARA